MKKRWTVGGSASWVTRKKNLRESPGRLTCWWNRLSRVTLFLSPWTEGFPKTSYSWPTTPRSHSSCLVAFFSLALTVIHYWLFAFQALCVSVLNYGGTWAKACVTEVVLRASSHKHTHIRTHTHTDSCLQEGWMPLMWDLFWHGPNSASHSLSLSPSPFHPSFRLKRHPLSSSPLFFLC